MVLIVIIVSLTPMILVSAMILGEFKQSYREKVYAHLSLQVLKHKTIIDSFLTERLNNIQQLAENCDFEMFKDDHFLESRLAILQNTYGIVFEDLGLIDENGIQVAYAGPYKLIKAEYADAEWFNEAINQDHYISDVFLGLRRLPHFIVSVKKNEGDKTWLLRATINFTAFNDLVENLQIGKTGFAFIVNREGNFQTNSKSEAITAKQLSLSFIKKDSNTDGIFIQEAFGASVQKQIILVTGFLKDNEWVMVFQQNLKDALFDFERAQNMAILIVMGGGLVIITMALFLSTITVNRIAKADREKEMMNQQVIETGKLASIGELAAGIAHEINNPVAIMVEEAGWIQDLLEEEEFQKSENLAEFSRALTQINSQGRRCKEITHKLLSFARKTDSTVQELQINELIEEVINLSTQRAKYSSVNVNTDLDQNLPLIPMSSTEFQQVLLNLINNAMDAMEKTGGKLDIGTRRQDDNIFITLADNGPGIPEVNLSRIFDPFFTTKPVGKGTGLGLSICYGLVKKMGGQIDVHSVINKGTTFTIRIPIKNKRGESFHSEQKNEPNKNL
ncbi:MAG: ATP-binding protein [Desulfobacterales bacterium]|nr:ATP-binding protein [Desulfobacterales bacterium]